jgi:DNA-binding response OmpR family regulator
MRVRTAGIEELWRYTADVLYILEHPVRSLRKKLQERASCVETVSGVGYRFRSE